MAYNATRRLQFCAGHRVHLHESKCRNMHGHNYVLHFSARAKKPEEAELDSLGRVIDFSVMKQLLGDWIDENWDHGFIHYVEDSEVRYALARIPTQKVYALPANPTAENMAAYLLHRVCPKLFKDTNIEIIKIVLHETENCSVEVTL